MWFNLLEGTITIALVDDCGDQVTLPRHPRGTKSFVRPHDFLLLA
jgi:hypothetical protein